MAAVVSVPLVIPFLSLFYNGCTGGVLFSDALFLVGEVEEQTLAGLHVE